MAHLHAVTFVASVLSVGLASGASVPPEGSAGCYTDRR